LLFVCETKCGHRTYNTVLLFTRTTNTNNYTATETDHISVTVTMALCTVHIYTKPMSVSGQAFTFIHVINSSNWSMGHYLQYLAT